MAPGTTRTPIPAAASADLLEQIRLTILKGRLAAFDDFVPTRVFLAAEDARHFLGQTLSPNGDDVLV